MIKKILLGALALFVFAVPASANAGTLSDDGLGVTHVSNFSRYPNTNSHWSRSETADAGQTVSFGIYYYNAGPGVASNVVVRLSPPSGGANNSYTLTGTIGGSNTNTLSGTASINLSSAQTLTPAGIYNWDRNTTGTGPALANGSAMLTSGGVSLGDLAEGEYGTVVARFTVGNQQVASVNEPIVTTNGTTNVTSNSCVFNGFVDARGSSNVTTWFEYGFGSGFGQTTGLQSFSGTGANSISAVASNLNPNSNYSYRAVAQRSGGPLVYGATQTCTTSSVVNNVNDPSVQTNSVSGLTQNSATLNGFVDTRNNSSVTSYFEFGPTASLGQTLGFQTFTNSTATSIAFTNFNLNPNTTYYYRAVAQRNGGPAVYGSIVSFTTSGFGTNNVNNSIVTTQDATRTNSDTTWVLNGFLSNNGSSQFNSVYFQYDETVSLGNQTSSQSLFNGSFSSTVANLIQGRTYYFRAVSQGNNGTSYGQILSFTTSGQFGVNNLGATQVTTLSASNPTSSTLQLNGQVFNSGTCQATTGFYEFGTTASLGNQTPVQTIASGSSATFYRVLQNLLAGRTYFYRAVAQDSCGNIVRGNILSAGTLGSAPVAPSYVAPVAEEIVQSPFILSFGYAPLRPFPGSEVTYRIAWKNDSGIKLNDALLRVNLPAGITFLSTESGFIRDGERNLLRPIGSVAKGASGAYLFRARIEQGVVLASDPAMGIQLSFFNPSTGANGSVSINGITRIGDGVSALNGTNNNTITTTVIDNTTSGSVAVTGTPTGDVATGLAFFGGLGGLFPTTGPGWVLLILAVALLLLVVRHYFLTDTRPKV